MRQVSRVLLLLQLALLSLLNVARSVHKLLYNTITIPTGVTYLDLPSHCPGLEEFANRHRHRLHQLKAPNGRRARERELRPLPHQQSEEDYSQLNMTVRGFVTQQRIYDMMIVQTLAEGCHRVEEETKKPSGPSRVNPVCDLIFSIATYTTTSVIVSSVYYRKGLQHRAHHRRHALAIELILTLRFIHIHPLKRIPQKGALLRVGDAVLVFVFPAWFPPVRSQWSV